MCQIQIQLVTETLDTDSILRSVHSDRCGAQLLFVGCTRSQTVVSPASLSAGTAKPQTPQEPFVQETLQLFYSAYESMATSELHLLATKAATTWPLHFLTIHHRLGRVAVGEASIAVAASSPHRAAVMEAIPWLMDAIKSQVPIWKQECSAEGTSQWVHP